LHPYHHITDYTYIDNTEALALLCETLKSKRVIAFDTEFVRTQTLNPMLGLIQVFDGHNVHLIDPVAINNLQSFADILSDKDIVKVAHSCSEDIEALLCHLQVVPTPVFDTQFAAAILGLGVSVGYANLLESIFKINIDKGESRTDWLQRPLSEAQCNYALADVTHLLALYEHLLPQVVSQNKLTWVYSEIAHLASKKQAVFPADLAYLNVKNNWKLRGHALACLQALSSWRMEMARTENKPLSFVLKDTALFELASKMPVNKHQLFECEHVYSKPARLYGERIIDICRTISTLSEDALPSKVQRLTDFRAYKQVLEKFKQLTESIAEKYQLPPSLFASKKQLNQVLKWFWFDADELEAQNLRPDLLSAWRFQLLESHLSQLKELVAQHHEIKRSL
jgi:ribonuclease D